MIRIDWFLPFLREPDRSRRPPLPGDERAREARLMGALADALVERAIC